MEVEETDMIYRMPDEANAWLALDCGSFLEPQI
jgi:hypothetical protein